MSVDLAFFIACAALGMTISTAIYVKQQMRIVNKLLNSGCAVEFKLSESPRTEIYQ